MSTFIEKPILNIPVPDSRLHRITANYSKSRINRPISIQIPEQRNDDRIYRCRVKCCEYNLFIACNKRKWRNDHNQFMPAEVYKKRQRWHYNLFPLAYIYEKCWHCNLFLYVRGGDHDLFLQPPHKKGSSAIEFLVCLSMNYYTTIIVLATYRFCYTSISLNLQTLVEFKSPPPTILCDESRPLIFSPT